MFLLFKIGNDRYALEASHAVEVIPFLALKKIPHAPRGVAGIFNYRGHPVPALDLTQLTLGHPAGERLSTRIILIQYPDATGRDRLLGLIASLASRHSAFLMAALISSASIMLIRIFSSCTPTSAAAASI